MGGITEIAGNIVCRQMALLNEESLKNGDIGTAGSKRNVFGNLLRRSDWSRDGGTSIPEYIGVDFIAGGSADISPSWSAANNTFVALIFFNGSVSDSVKRS